MKLKYYLRGLGVGIILTAIIMMIAASGEKTSMTDEEIIERAKELGMIMAEEEPEPEEEAQKPKPEADKEETQKPNPEEEKGEAQKPKPEEEKEETQKPKPEEEVQKPKPEEEKGEAQKPKPEEEKGEAQKPELITVEIISGEYSDQISVKVFEAGLVEDAGEFNRYLVESGLDERIAVGKHQIPKGATVEEIAKILCEEPVN